MDKAKLDIENKLVPKGVDVVRHLSLPAEGKSPEWILAEMDKMDNEINGHVNWRQGKLSGAVYRKGFYFPNIIKMLSILQMVGRSLKRS